MRKCNATAELTGHGSANTAATPHLENLQHKSVGVNDPRPDSPRTIDPSKHGPRAFNSSEACSPASPHGRDSRS